ncbi:hypothetical protein [Neorhizobium galegae]|jgi:hypothetical protein|uniref:Uncharacterized protein n=1 Tax=Neorhizobium galegae bv. orientalis str. HAMBI 540 TaxID=1028800 RepID=A0A068SZU8_NEOGA|nr:hypothetical protein [Neorhizobium galegae]MCQ1851567.1 hypothetical protein [Neorhizobium galegae]CDN50725.1 Hypothetical protein RG540_PA00460 [Neorhizobium galegae bv. orientalis str. HAMBI 540]CDZ43597.1 Hypothetical protein NGAL_HAMBI2427_02300 [Neorhizobium galegae bv. orientalis]
MKTSISAIAAMIAAASFAGSALAEGDYYEGTSKAHASAQINGGNLDGVRTGSIQIRDNDRQENPSIFGDTSRDNR